MGKSKKTKAKVDPFHQDCLTAHNAKRALHGSDPLTLADDLSRMAQKWADHLIDQDM